VNAESLTRDLRKGEGFADYVLSGDDGNPLGLVEAKRTKRDARVASSRPPSRSTMKTDWPCTPAAECGRIFCGVSTRNRFPVRRGER